MMTPRSVVARIGDTVRQVEVRADGTALVSESASRDTEPPVTTELSLAYLGHGRLRVSRGGSTKLAYAVEDGDSRWVFVDGVVVRVEIEQPGARKRGRAASGHESLSAPMPATVIRILVAPGDAVAKGAPLVILEAMKMEMPLRAPHDAIVEAVRCATGELVQPGVALIDLDETVGAARDA
jgi:3-methylcrotonyl-CoA carboxylase alpha subunit